MLMQGKSQRGDFSAVVAQLTMTWHCFQVKLAESCRESECKHTLRNELIFIFLLGCIDTLEVRSAPEVCNWSERGRRKCTRNWQQRSGDTNNEQSLPQGLAALLVQGLSNCSPEEIIRIQPEFIEKLGLGQALTPSRNNGFLNMFKLMQAKALKLLVWLASKLLHWFWTALSIALEVIDREVLVPVWELMLQIIVCICTSIVI